MINNAFEIVKELRSSEWLTKAGFWLYSIGILIISFTTIYFLKGMNIPLNIYWVIGILALPQVTHLIFWWKERNFSYDPEILTVAFGITVEDSSKTYYREIKKQFKEQIATYQLNDDLRIKELPSDINFTDTGSAEKFISKKGIRLLVWGNTNEGNKNNAPFTQFNLKLSYQHGVAEKQKREKFVDEIGIAIQRKHWGVWQPNSFHQLIVVSGNIFEISLFTLGACLATVRSVSYLLKSVDIFEKLNAKLKQREQNADFPNLHFVKQRVRSFLRDGYNVLLIFYWDKQKDLEKAIEYADKAIKIDENNFIAHQNMSVFQWRKGNKNLAQYHTERAWRIQPGDPLPRFNKAFFFIDEQKFEKGLKEYKKIDYAGDTNIMDVIEFIEKEFEKIPGNLGMLFAAGWLNIQYADHIRGIDQLNDFLLQSNDNQKYRILITETKKILLSQMTA